MFSLDLLGCGFGCALVLGITSSESIDVSIFPACLQPSSSLQDFLLIISSSNSS